jgi:HAD superfamily hydrolase (TIGR01490 family)
MKPENMKHGHAPKRKFAVFDIDGTIFRSSLLIELVEELIRMGLFPQKAKAEYDRAEHRWLDRKGGYERYILAVIKAFDLNLRGVHEKDFLRIVRRVVREHRHRVYRYTRDLVRELRRKGYYLLAISHSPKYIAGPFAKQLGFHKTYGMLFELDARTKRFTGRRLHTDIMLDKAAALRRAVEKEGLALRGSVGVGDTESDIPMLRLVERPICFNPNRALYQAARRYGWKVVVERKDMVYENLVARI